MNTESIRVIDQELEDAADNWVDSHYNKGVEYSKAKRGAANPKSGFIAGAAWQKEQSAIPIDVEIEKKADEYAYEIKGQLYTEKGQHPSNKAWSLLSRGYTNGYKQALKDLGYTDN